MICYSCGRQNDPGAAFCAQCNAPLSNAVDTASYGQPQGIYGQQPPGVDQAMPGYGQQPSGVDQAMPGYGQQPPGVDQAMPGYDQPASAYDQSAANYDQPAHGYAQPPYPPVQDQPAGIGYAQQMPGYGYQPYQQAGVKKSKTPWIISAIAVAAVAIIAVVLFLVLGGNGNSADEDLDDDDTPSVSQNGEDNGNDPIEITTTPPATITIDGETINIDVLELDLSYKGISDITQLQSLTRISRLSLMQNQISDISPLRSLTSLTSLAFNANQVVDITPVQSLTNLTSLNMAGNEISYIGPVQSLSGLAFLSIAENQISDISPLQPLSNLTYLDASSNHIDDITSLQFLSELVELFLYDNQITDITPLKSLVNLQQVDLYGNPLTPEQLWELQEALPDCVIHPTPEPVPHVGRIISVSAGNNHTMALDDRGQVWVWGDNYFGQIGNGGITTYLDPEYDEDPDEEYWPVFEGNIKNADNDAYRPQLIMGGVRAIYARENSSFAITDNGELFAWGQNDMGQLGDGTRINRLVPVFIDDEVLDIDHSRQRTIILKTDHTLWISGSRFGPWDSGDYPEPELFFTNVRKAVLEGATNYGGVLMLTTDGRLYHYTDPSMSYQYELLEITGLGDITDISTAAQQVYVLNANGDVYGWGAHAGYDLGADFDEFWVESPSFIASNIWKIPRGRFLITEDGALLTWGEVKELIDYRNSQGSSGGGYVGDLLVVYGALPVPVLGNVYMADGIDSHFVALDNDGNVYTWGENFNGQLGIGGSENQIAPQRVSFG